MTQIAPFTSVLIANRGEIALRILRTLHALGLRAIAVYTDADADAPHVALADIAINIGTGPVADSYLSIPRLIEAAHQSGAGAIHPGYGFLSENADFARACCDAGLVFIGPSAQSIDQMGNKSSAKTLMIGAGVPCVPGYQGTDQSDETLHQQAGKITYPVMIKAAAGGGGRGMRLVTKPSDFTDALHLARAESLAAFGSDQVILERALIGPRHVEIQIFADAHGTTLHMGERDCSIQRRHQKRIEESPCPVLTPTLRAEMGAAAIKAARAVNYLGAGTVEFLLDASGAFYFLEMNTRLQVEHPVTEMVTGLDLVALQIAVAQGHPLNLTQADITLTGHAIEARLYAEDPANDFLPATGKIQLWQPPSGPGIRTDAGIATGQIISPHYDPMLAKIIAYGETRDIARQRLIAALRDCALFGPPTNRDFLINALARPTFAQAQATTAYIAEEFGAHFTQAPDFTDIALAAALLHDALYTRAAARALSAPPELRGWGSPGTLISRLTLRDRTGKTHTLSLCTHPNGSQTIANATFSATITRTHDTLRIDGRRIDLRASQYDGAQIHIATATKTYAMTHHRATGQAAKPAGSGTITAPMHGQLTKLLIAIGDPVTPGTRLAILEAMKMQHELCADIGGTITAIHVLAGTQMTANQPLIEITPDP
jgi:geranyl-CoA carboxylase alpha subunit